MLIPVPWFETTLQVFADSNSDLRLTLVSLHDVFSLTDSELQWFMGRSDLSVVMHQGAALYLVTHASVCIFFGERSRDPDNDKDWDSFMNVARVCYGQILKGLQKTIDERIQKLGVYEQ